MLRFALGKYCDQNHHGTQKRGERWNQETIRGWALRFLPLDNVVRRIPGFRVMLYAPSGKCWNFDAFIDSKRKTG